MRSSTGLRERIASFLELPPPPAAPDVRVVDRTPEDGYTRSLIQYSAPEGDQVEAFLFEPTRQKPLGAVLALHQHNSQWTIGKSEIAGLAGDPLQAFGPALARLGVTVLAPDAVGFESRVETVGGGKSLAPPLDRPHSTAEGWLQYYNQMAHRLVRGGLLMRTLLADCATALTVVQHLDDVDAGNLGVVGHSFGGILALFLAALDTRVAFACSSGAVCSFRHKLANRTALEMSLIIPRFAQQFDVEDLIQCVAPRRFFVVSSEDDPHAADAADLVRDSLPAFRALNCADHLQHLRVPGSHALDSRRFEAILEWTLAQTKAH